MLNIKMRIQTVTACSYISYCFRVGGLGGGAICNIFEQPPFISPYKFQICEFISLSLHSTYDYYCLEKFYI